MMNPCKSILVAILITKLFLNCAGTKHPLVQTGNEPQRPNIVFILADDLGYADLACYGNKTARTANLDRLAGEGLRFTDFYATAPTCSPSRAALLTGRQPIRTGVNAVLYPTAPAGMPLEEVTLAELLKTRGYATGMVGKWHLGNNPDYLPTRQGFDSYFGIPYSNDMKGQVYLRNETIAERSPSNDSTTYRYTAESLRFIEENRTKPFFLYLAHAMPHVPLGATPGFRGKSKGGAYGDAVEELDWSVGQIWQKLNDLRLDDNTLLVFTSDNGPWLGKGKDAGSAGGLRGGKFMTYEGGMRVPCVAWWPGHIPPGRTTGEVSNLTDWLPTLAALTGSLLPAVPLDGQDISAMLTGRGHRANQELFYFSGTVLQAYRDGNWKLKKAFEKGPNLNDPESHPLLLINLKDDPGESRNLAGQYPDRVRAMLARMEAYQQSLGALPKTVVTR